MSIICPLKYLIPVRICSMSSVSMELLLSLPDPSHVVTDLWRLEIVIIINLRQPLVLRCYPYSTKTLPSGIFNLSVSAVCNFSLSNLHEPLHCTWTKGGKILLSVAFHAFDRISMFEWTPSQMTIQTSICNDFCIQLLRSQIHNALPTIYSYLTLHSVFIQAVFITASSRQLLHDGKLLAE